MKTGIGNQEKRRKQEKTTIKCGYEVLWVNCVPPNPYIEALTPQ